MDKSLRTLTASISLISAVCMSSSFLPDAAGADNPKSQGLVVKNQFTFAYCKNTTSSKYYGVASARATIRGKAYTTPPVWSEKTLELNCGT
jgi:hypothetical protein